MLTKTNGINPIALEVINAQIKLPPKGTAMT